MMHFLDQIDSATSRLPSLASKHHKDKGPPLLSRDRVAVMRQGSEDLDFLQAQQAQRVNTHKLHSDRINCRASASCSALKISERISAVPCWAWARDILV